LIGKPHQAGDGRSGDVVFIDNYVSVPAAAAPTMSHPAVWSVAVGMCSRRRSSGVNPCF
jgi:hypothetical protein